MTGRRSSVVPIVMALAGAFVAAAGAASRAVAQARPDVQGAHAAVVADHPLAAAAGADVLRRGGNAMDAAITMAAVLAVVRPHMNGIGGDAFMLIRDARPGRVQALNGSGRAAERATPAALRALGHANMPTSGVQTVTVPGAVAAWADALRRHGTISLADALAPAIHYAANGFAVSDKLAADISASRSKLEADRAMAAVFLPGGQVPEPGTLLRQADLAASLQLLATHGAEVFYAGEIAARIDRFMQFESGLLTFADFAAHSSTWQQPISTAYEGYRVIGFPPNSQGVALLMQMNMAGLFDQRGFGHNDAAYVHTLVEICRLAFAERDRYITDPAFAEIPLDEMLSMQHATALVASWAARTALHPNGSDTPPDPDPDDGAAEGGAAEGGAAEGGAAEGGAADGEVEGDGDTVFLAAVDAQGNSVALIQSLYNAFGSGRMVPGTGIVLHNRGASFTLDSRAANVIAPRKRPYHTLSPAMALNQDGSLFMLFGTPGADGQTQTKLQVFNNVVLFGMSPQRAVEAPRWRSWPSGRLQVEVGIDAEVRARLESLGHQVTVQHGLSADLGGAQVIMVLPSGVRRVGADPRREAYGIAW